MNQINDMKYKIKKNDELLKEMKEVKKKNNEIEEKMIEIKSQLKKVQKKNIKIKEKLGQYSNERQRKIILRSYQNLLDNKVKKIIDKNKNKKWELIVNKIKLYYKKYEN